MSETRTAQMEALLPRIMPQVLPCPRSMALDAIQLASCQRLRLWTPKSVRRFASHARKKAGKADGKTEGDKQISETADAQAHR